MSTIFPYEDIVNMTHPTSKTRSRMPQANRAAQFASFAALNGYEEAVAETARYTEDKPDLTEETIQRIDQCLQLLSEKIHTAPFVRIDHFIQDKKKPGGSIVTSTGFIKQIDPLAESVTFLDGTVIRFSDVLVIHSELLRDLE